MTSSILPSPRWRIHISIGKKYRLSPSIYTFFGLIFQKPLTCIRNYIVLHAYFNLKCNGNWRKAGYHASSDSVTACCQLRSMRVCVCVMSDFRILHHFTQMINKIFPRPTDPTFWAVHVCNRNQTIILSRPYMFPLLQNTTANKRNSHNKLSWNNKLELLQFLW